MIPRGAAHLIAMRKAGKRIDCEVWITLGDFIETKWEKYSNTCDKPELLIRPEDPIERMDLRCVAGLKVILFFSAYDSRAIRLFERLQEYCAEIAVMSPEFDEDIGWRWIRGIGRVEYGDTHFIADLEAAKGDRYMATRSDDKAAYARATDAENKIMEAAPWLKY